MNENLDFYALRAWLHGRMHFGGVAGRGGRWLVGGLEPWPCYGVILWSGMSTNACY